MTAGPFMRWLGGKWRLADAICEKLPPFSRYHEPMLGSGSIMLKLAESGRITGDSLEASDANPYLIRAWKGVLMHQADVKAHFMAHHVPKHSYGHFLSQRERQIEMLETDDDVEATSWFLYLNRASYNGLWRARADGRLNTPWGKKPLQTIQNFRKLDWVCELMRWRGIRPCNFHCRDVGVSLGVVGDRDLAYVDPPYVGTFNNYNAKLVNSWDAEARHEQLAESCVHAWYRGASVAVSQSQAAAPTYGRVLGPNAARHDIRAHRHISRDASTRGKVTEHLYVLTRRETCESGPNDF